MRNEHIGLDVMLLPIDQHEKLLLTAWLPEELQGRKIIGYIASKAHEHITPVDHHRVLLEYATSMYGRDIHVHMTPKESMNSLAQDIRGLIAILNEEKPVQYNAIIVRKSLNF
jgi:hypothetical protein